MLPDRLKTGLQAHDGEALSDQGREKCSPLGLMWPVGAKRDKMGKWFKWFKRLRLCPARREVSAVERRVRGRVRLSEWVGVPGLALLSNFWLGMFKFGRSLKRVRNLEGMARRLNLEEVAPDASGFPR